MVNCNCGQEATYHCTSCTPPTLLCLACIPSHLTQNLEDCIKPLKPKTPTPIMCESCNTNQASKLGVFSTHSKKLCKNCKSIADFCIDLKWSDLVSKQSDIFNISQRKSALALLNEELDQSQPYSTLEVSLSKLKSDMYQIVNTLHSEKLKELSSLSSTYDNLLCKLKKEVAEQSFQRDLDLNSEAGRLINSFLQNSPIDLSHLSPKLISPTLQDFQHLIQSYYSNIKLWENPTAPEKSVFLFTPGKNVLVKINLELMTKSELVFDKTWNFEASWLVLSSGNIFFCGGNGRDNSEVLLVSLSSRTVKSLQTFSGRSGHSLVQIEKSVYVFGGNKGNSTEKYLLNEDKWVSLAQIPCKMSRTCCCVNRDGALVTGGDCDRIFLYNVERDLFGLVEFPLEGYAGKNKIMFVNEDMLYVLTGDKIFVSRTGQRGVEESFIGDRDWWSYSAPVVHKGCAYFVKYFVRNLWCLNLETLKLNETTISSIS